MGKDYYKILGVSKNASSDELKRAFKKLARKYHPDVNKEAGSEDTFKEINEAYQVLSDNKKRSQYDQHGSDAFKGHNFRQDFNFNDIFSEIFGNSGFGDMFGRGRRVKRGRDVRVNLELSLEEVYKGAQKSISFSVKKKCDKCHGQGGKDVKTCGDCRGAGQRQVVRNMGFTQFVTSQTCTSCQGQGSIVKEKCVSCRGEGLIRSKQDVKVNVPVGVNNGEYTVLKGRGEDVKGQGESGDLIIVFNVLGDNVFEREDENLFTEVTIPLMTALYGGSVEIDVFGKKTTLKIPHNMQSHTIFKLKGLGFETRWSRGSLFVKVVVDIPKVKKKDEKLLSEAFGKQKGFSFSKGFFERFKF